MIKGGRALASMLIGFVISVLLLLGAWSRVPHAFGVTLAPGVPAADQVRRLLRFNLPVVVQLIFIMLVSAGSVGILVYAIWTIIDRQIRRRKA